MSKDFKINKQELLGVYRQALLKNVSLDELNEKVIDFSKRNKANQNFEKELDQKIKSRFWQRIPQFIKVGAAAIPLILISIGIVLAGSAAWPIISQMLPSNGQKVTDLLSPLSGSQIANVGNLVFAKSSVIDENKIDKKAVLDEPIILDYNLDYTDLSNWFDEQSSSFSTIDYKVEEYRLDIPSLNISNTKVRIGGTDLNKSLIQYPGTALPGEPGAPVIFGHSVLRQFYNPSEKNSRRYSSIFSKIMTLKSGDKIYVTYNNVKYTYQVQSNTEVQPTDTFILAQRYDVRQLKLVTCVPEGTVLRRGIVIAQLVKE
jgi:LPXTG-site transpeptidase (sortase) family protein